MAAGYTELALNTGVTYPAVDIIAAMEELSLDDAIEAVGGTILGMDDVPKGTLQTLLTTANVKVVTQAKVFKALTKQAASVCPNACTSVSSRSVLMFRVLWSCRCRRVRQR